MPHSNVFTSTVHKICSCFISVKCYEMCVCVRSIDVTLDKIYRK